MVNDKFEELIKKYQEIADKLESEDLSLNESIDLYKESDQIYNKLNKILEDASLEIENIREKNI